MTNLESPQHGFADADSSGGLIQSGEIVPQYEFAPSGEQPCRAWAILIGLVVVLVGTVTEAKLQAADCHPLFRGSAAIGITAK